VQFRRGGRGNSSRQVSHLAAVVAGLVDSATVAAATVATGRPHYSGRGACRGGSIMVVGISRRGGTAATFGHQVAAFPAQAAGLVLVRAVAHLREEGFEI